MSVHLTPREGCFQALREEGCVSTRAPSLSAAAFNILALPTVASLCSSPSEPSRQPSLQLSPHVLAVPFRGIPSGRLGRAVVHDTCIARFFSTGDEVGVSSQRSRQRVRNVPAAVESSRPARRCVPRRGKRAVPDVLERDCGRGVGSPAGSCRED